jgi:hypothetical protein
MTKRRSTRSLLDVAEDVLHELKTVHGVTDKELDRLRARVRNSGNYFPLGGIKVPRNILHLNYVIQRDPIVKHILNLLNKWDCRICQPLACYTTPDKVRSIAPDVPISRELATLARNGYDFESLYIYDAQHRAISLSILGIDDVYVTVVIEPDTKFASMAFRESNSMAKKIGPPDYHRINLNLYAEGERDVYTISAYNLQEAFNTANVDLMEQKTHDKLSEKERRPWWFSHFKYAQTTMKNDIDGVVVADILRAMTSAWPNDHEMDNCIFIGLYQMHGVVSSLAKGKMPRDWMSQVCVNLATSFPTSRDLTHAAGSQIRDFLAGGSWNVPESMYKFMRELYIMNGGKLLIPSKGGVINLANGDWCTPNLIPNHKQLYRPRAGVVVSQTLKPLRAKK